MTVIQQLTGTGEARHQFGSPAVPNLLLNLDVIAQTVLGLVFAVIVAATVKGASAGARRPRRLPAAVRPAASASAAAVSGRGGRGRRTRRLRRPDPAAARTGLPGGRARDAAPGAGAAASDAARPAGHAPGLRLPAAPAGRPARTLTYGPDERP